MCLCVCVAGALVQPAHWSIIFAVPFKFAYQSKIYMTVKRTHSHAPCLPGHSNPLPPQANANIICECLCVCVWHIHLQMFYMQIPQRSQRQSCEAVEEGGAQGAAAAAEGVGKDVEEGGGSAEGGAAWRCEGHKSERQRGVRGSWCEGQRIFSYLPVGCVCCCVC